MSDKGNGHQVGKPGFVEIDPLLPTDARQLLRKVQKVCCGWFFSNGKNLIQKGTKQYPEWMVNDGDHTC